MTWMRAGSALALGALLLTTPSPARAEGEGSRWIAALPFGAGQFQNGDEALGIVFALTEAIAGGLSITSSVVANRIVSSNPPPFRIADVNDRIRTVSIINQVAFTTWAVGTVAGVTEAQVSFGRKKTAEAPLATAVVPVAGGAVVAVGGAF